MTVDRPTEAEWIAAHKIIEASPLLSKVVTYMIEAANEDGSTMLAAAIEAFVTGKARTAREALKIAFDAANENVYARHADDERTDPLH